MKRLLAICAALGLAAACGGDPEPVFLPPVITDVTVSAEAQAADIAFRVTGGEATRCGVNYSEDSPGAAVIRAEGTLNEGLAEVKLGRLAAATAYRFTPWADNGKFEIKGEEHFFVTEALADVRIYDFVCSAPSTSSVTVSFRYSAPERVVSACLWYWPASAAGISDPAAKRIPVAASPSGKISLIVSGLEQNTAYNAQPFIYTEEGEIIGPIQQFSTTDHKFTFAWDTLYANANIPHILHLVLSINDRAGICPSWYYIIQEGDRITFDENSYIVGPFQGPGSGGGYMEMRYYFAKSQTQYTILPFARGYMGEPRTVTTGTTTDYCLRNYIQLLENSRMWTLTNDVPDPAFRQYILDNFDTDHDGQLSNDEANSVRHIDCRNMGITSLKGIERFQNVVSINCSGNPVKEISLEMITIIFGLVDLRIWRMEFLKEFIALDMNDSNGNNVLKRLIIGRTDTRIMVPDECIIDYRDLSHTSDYVISK